MKKRILVMLAAVVLVLALPAAARADYIHGYFRYTIEDESVTITAYYGNESEVVVPAMIGTYPVNTVKAGVFSGTSVQKVYLPETIMTIEEGAFSPGQTVAYYADESEIEKTAPAEPVGIADESGNLVTTDEDGNLVSVSPEGEETVLDDSQNYTMETDDQGQTVITGENDEPVEVAEDGTVSFTDADDNKVTVSTTEGTRTTVSPDGKTGTEEVDVEVEDAEEDKADDAAENAVTTGETVPNEKAASPLRYVLIIAAAAAVIAIIAVSARKRRVK